MNPSVSIIIPVFHEAAVINRTLAGLRRQNFAGSLDIVVVDASPQGDTISAIQDKGVIKALGKKGRGAQMNRGAGLARGEVLVFLHADTVLGKGALAKAASVCAVPDIAGGAFDLKIDSLSAVYRIIERAASLRSRITRIPYGDQAIFLKAEIFRRIGGFNDIPIMEDVDLMRRVKRSGARIEILSLPVSTSARRWQREGALFCTLRNWSLISLYLLGADPRRLARFYK
jgi:rSAM/selenodomain-associated transferase 2